LYAPYISNINPTSRIFCRGGVHLYSRVSCEMFGRHTI